MSDGDQEVLLREADMLIGLGRHEEAGQRLAGFLAGAPDHAEAWCLLGVCQSQLQNLDGALESLDRSLAADPGRSRPWRVRANILVQQQRYDEAVAAGGEAVRISPEDWAAHTVYALARSQQPGGLPEAYQAAVHATALAPQEAAAHYVVGRVAQRQGNREIADRAYRTALRLQPDYAVARIGLGELGMRAPRWRDRGRTSLRHFAAALAADPQSVYARRHVEAVALGLLARAGWGARMCLLVAALLARNTPYAVRLAAFAAAVAVWAAWGWRTHRSVPERLRPWMRSLVVRSAAVRSAAGGFTVCVLCQLVILAVPGPRAAVPVVATGFVLGVVSALAGPWAGIRLLRRRVASEDSPAR